MFGKGADIVGFSRLRDLYLHRADADGVGSQDNTSRPCFGLLISADTYADAVHPFVFRCGNPAGRLRVVLRLHEPFAVYGFDIYAVAFLADVIEGETFGGGGSVRQCDVQGRGQLFCLLCDA